MTDAIQWFEQHHGQEMEVYVDDGRVFFIVADGHGDADAYYSDNLQGEIKYPGA